MAWGWRNAQPTRETQEKCYASDPDPVGLVSFIVDMMTTIINSTLYSTRRSLFGIVLCCEQGELRRRTLSMTCSALLALDRRGSAAPRPGHRRLKRGLPQHARAELERVLEVDTAPH